MKEKNNFYNFMKQLIKKEIKQDKDTNSDNLEIQNIKKISSNEKEETIEKNSIEDKNEEEFNEIINNSKLYRLDNDNSNIERVANNMVDIKNRATTPCDITNKLNQVVLKVSKKLVSKDNLSNIAVSLNSGRVDDFEVLDVAFKYNHEIPNPCGDGIITGEALLKAVVIVGLVNYSWILYDTITNEIIYDGTKDTIMAYSVYDIVKFEDNSIKPASVEAQFTPNELSKVDVIDDENLDFYIFKVSGTVDLIGV